MAHLQCWCHLWKNSVNNPSARTHIYTGSPFSFWNLVDLKYGFDYDLKRAVKDSECYLFYMKNTALWISKIEQGLFFFVDLSKSNIYFLMFSKTGWELNSVPLLFFLCILNASWRRVCSWLPGVVCVCYSSTSTRLCFSY